MCIGVTGGPPMRFSIKMEIQTCPHARHTCDLVLPRVGWNKKYFSPNMMLEAERQVFGELWFGTCRGYILASQRPSAHNHGSPCTHASTIGLMPDGSQVTCTCQTSVPPRRLFVYVWVVRSRLCINLIYFQHTTSVRTYCLQCWLALWAWSLGN